MMKTKILATLTLALSLAAVGADKKPAPIAGTYKGEIKGEQATAVLKADGSISIRPRIDGPKFVIRGSWKHNGNAISAKMKDPSGEEGTVIFKMDGDDLVLEKVIDPSGEVEEFAVPEFKRNRKLAEKGPAGVYVGWFDDEHLSVQVKPDGAFTVTPCEDLKGGPIYTGKWKATEIGLRATVRARDEEGDEEATVEFATTATGLAITKVVNGDGEVERYNNRLKRQPRAGNKKPRGGK